MKNNPPIQYRIMTAIDDSDVFARRKHTEKDLRYFLIPWLMFRATISFKDGKRNSYNYGHEHQVTYSQLLHKRFDHVVLDRAKGFNDLVRWIDHKKSNIKTAKIYTRSVEGGELDILCREFYKGEWVDHELPDFNITGTEKILYYFIDEKKYGWPIVVLQESDPAKEDFTIKL